jgi:hypothetical protein
MQIIQFPSPIIDITSITPVVRRAHADVRKRVFRRARRERIAAKESFLRSGH